MKRVALSLITALAAASTGWTQTAYPNRPVKLVLGFTPGSAADVVERLNRETARALAGPDIKAQFAVQGVDTMSTTPEQLAVTIRQETAKWARVVQASGARVD